jgi:hypothetical protein
MTVRFRLRGRRPEAKLIETYAFPEGTVHLHRADGGRVRWSCDCQSFQTQPMRLQEQWCEHITRAAALRSIDRLMRWRA